MKSNKSYKKDNPTTAAPGGKTEKGPSRSSKDSGANYDGPHSKKSYRSDNPYCGKSGKKA